MKVCPFCLKRIRMFYCQQDNLLYERFDYHVKGNWNDGCLDECEGSYQTYNRYIEDETWNKLK